MTGRILQNNNGIYVVETEQGVFGFPARGGMKNIKLHCGDIAIIEDGVIVGIEERKNILIRPSVANIDVIIAVISCVPKPDLLMLDKLIINCRNVDIGIGIVINKSDINDKQFAQKIKDEYDKAVDFIIETSATNGDLQSLIDSIGNKTVCLAGQSAVGKSSIINTLFGNSTTLIGELSKKISRGKNTTVTSRLYPFNNGYIIDTPGFGLLDAHGVSCEQVKYFYPEFTCDCEYTNCNHIDEPGCSVRQNVEKGLVNNNRYLRYKIIYSELKSKGDKYEKH